MSLPIVISTNLNNKLVKSFNISRSYFIVWVTLLFKNGENKD